MKLSLILSILLFFSKVMSSDSLAFICQINPDDPLTLLIENETVVFRSIDIQHKFKLLRRTNSKIEWEDTSYMKVPFNVKFSLDLTNSEIKVGIFSEEETTTIKCIHADERKIKDYEKEMTQLSEQEGWVPALPTLSSYLNLAENKDHPKIIHQMNLRCTAFYALMLKSSTSMCSEVDPYTQEPEFKECVGDQGYLYWKTLVEGFDNHFSKAWALNKAGNYLSDEQTDMQSLLFNKAYSQSITNFLNKEEGESCLWGNASGFLCWEEELHMCKKLREEESMQEWWENLMSD